MTHPRRIWTQLSPWLLLLLTTQLLLSTESASIKVKREIITNDASSKVAENSTVIEDVHPAKGGLNSETIASNSELASLNNEAAIVDREVNSTGEHEKTLSAPPVDKNASEITETREEDDSIIGTIPPFDLNK